MTPAVIKTAAPESVEVPTWHASAHLVCVIDINTISVGFEIMTQVVSKDVYIIHSERLAENISNIGFCGRYEHRPVSDKVDDFTVESNRSNV